MHHSHTNAPDAVTRFFDNYLKCLHKASIPEKQRRWYVIRLEAFIKAHSERKIKSLTGQDIHQYLDTIGRQNNLAGWQFYQCVDAIRILYCALPVPYYSRLLHRLNNRIGDRHGNRGTG